MASRAIDFGRASALPLDTLLAAIPSLPRPLLSRLVQRAIEHMDEQDGDPDIEDDDPLEVAWVDNHHDWGGFIGAYANEDDEDDDPAGGNCEDEGEDVPSAWALPTARYGIDQREIIGSGWRFDRDDWR